MIIVVVGGGPAGMLAAIAAAKSNKKNLEKVKEPSRVILLEKNDKLGKKLFITGKGRCNLTNDCDKEEFFANIVRNPRFFYSAFSAFSNKDLINFVEDNGCKLKVERGNRVFPVSDKSYDVIDALKMAIKRENIVVRLNTKVINTTYKLNCLNKIKSDIGNLNKFVINIDSNKKIIADKVIIATGGLSYKSTGSTGDGYKFAKSFDINVVRQEPSLVPFVVKELSDCKEIQGLTLKNISIKMYHASSTKKVLYSDFGELLFTHFGVSGPVILSASCYINLPYDEMLSNINEIENNIDDPLILSIDLKPALDFNQLDNRLLREINNNKNKKIKTIIENLLPSSLIKVFFKRLSSQYKQKNKNMNFWGVDIEEVRCSNISKDLRICIIELLKDFRFTIKGKRGFGEAIITRGGIDVKEINPKTMESKKIRGLYFAGEVIDIDAMTGGFNIQIASSTGYLAGISAATN